MLVNNFASVTNGSNGVNVPLPFWSSDYQNMPFYYLFLALLAATVGFAAWVRRTKFGTGLLAIREDEDKAAAIGVNTTRYKVLAYAASAVPIGVAGVVYAYFLSFLNPIGAFSLLTSVTIVLSALLGGRGTLWGPVLGGFVVSIGTEVANVYGGGTDSRLLVLGIALVLVVLFLPRGVLPTVGAYLARRRAAKKKVEYTDQAGVATARTPIVVTPRSAPAAERRAAPAAGDPGRQEELRRPARRRRRRPHRRRRARSPRSSARTARARRRCSTWSPAPCPLGERRDLVRRHADRPAAAVGAGAPRPGPHLPDHPAVQEHDGAGERGRRRCRRRAGGSWPRTPSAGTRRSGRGSCWTSSASAGSATSRPARLSYGQQKLVELAQVLMLEPKMILLDEPAGGINPTLVNRMVEIIRDLNRQGIAFLVVEHNIPLVLDLCDPVAVLSRGQVIAQGPPSIVRADPAVLEAYLGPEWLPADPVPDAVLDQPSLSVKGS